MEAQVRLRDLVSGTSLRVWNALPGHDEADVPTFLHTTLPLIDAGQRQAASLVDGFLARSMGRQPMGIDPGEFTGEAVRAVPPEELYRRPFVLLWTGLKDGKLWEEANNAAAARLRDSVRTSLLLSVTHSARAVAMEDPDILGFRRVPHGTCDLCAEVVDGATPAAGLQPIHPGCECAVEPITRVTLRSSPSRAWMAPLLDGDEFALAASARQDRTSAVQQHGEMGPILAYKDQNFRTAGAT